MAKKRSKIDVLKSLSKRMTTEDTTKLPLMDGDEDISRVEGCDVDFFITIAEPTLRDVEDFQVSSMKRIADDEGNIVVQARPVDALLSLVENKVLVDARLPIIEEGGKIGHVRMNGSPKAIEDNLNEHITYTMAMTLMDMVLTHLGLSDDTDDAEVIEEGKN